MIPEKQIFWHQGLFLQPQHFQQTELYHQSLLTPLNQYRQPFCWGIRKIKINESALLSRVVEFTEFEAVFQDFTWVVGGENCILPSRSFAELEDIFAEEDSLLVYVGLRRWDRFSENVTTVNSRSAHTDTRYISIEDPVEQKDLYEEGPPAQVRFLEHNLRIFWHSEKETAGDYHLIPVVRLVMNGETIVQDKTYVPPPLTLESSHHLLQIVKNINEQMLARCRFLESYKPVQGIDMNRLEVVAMYHLFALNCLNRYVAFIQYHLSTPLIHPWQIYGVFTQLAAELSTFSDRINGQGQLRDGTSLMSRYDHLNAGHCFNDIQKLISELLSALVIGSENIVIMTRQDDRFMCEIPAEFFGDRYLYCLMVRTAADAQEVINALLHHVKAGSCSDMDTLIRRSLSGVRLAYQDIPPLGIVQRDGCYCFKIATDSPRWQKVQEDATLCVHWDHAPEDVSMELVVTKL